eukprot:1175726-Prorocentrum_minimum.AAC.2
MHFYHGNRADSESIKSDRWPVMMIGTTRHNRNRRLRHTMRHEDGLQFRPMATAMATYNAGSCMDVLNEDGDKEARTGVGVFSQRDDVRLSFRTIVPVSVQHAELAGILRAVEMDAQPEAKPVDTYTQIA